MVYRNLYMDKINRVRNNGLIKIITGVRRSGKSYILNTIRKTLIKEGINDENIIFIDLELPNYNYLTNRIELDEIIIPLLENTQDKKYLFIDEIQNINEWEKSINGYYKAYDVDIYITGSNSKLLSKELATFLTGRYLEIKIYPFSFNEFLEYKEELNTDCIIDNNLNSPIENLFEEYFQYGGLPLVISNDIKDKKTILQDVYSSILLYDIVERYKIRNTGILQRIIKYLIENVGNLISANNIYSYLKRKQIKITPNTVYNYLEYLENAYFISNVTREDAIGLNEIINSEKCYLIDQGFYKSNLEEKQKNFGHLLENIVYLELLRNGYKVTIGKLKKYEIDFIARKDDEKIYIQVTYNLSNKKTLNRELKPLLEIRDNYPKYLISKDRENYSTKGIKHYNIIQFLKEFKDF
ncbi:ATP-binding protein [Methanosphaera sp. ISO3-F5]|uniref:ATP-binding protein n=1 Tax=Methanosphaera sp. ISO3-F5 TaxID=1452353 RepID=UPI002B26469F|nr:ATP-binding protein [Methanosphaera sp. ISO3-F5]WQH63864.1 ATP-binding protein [Methanosphaera sp. ISO3-F5]